MNRQRRNLIIGLGGAVLTLAGLVAAAFLLLAPAGPAAEAGGQPNASECATYPVPDASMAPPGGLESWKRTGVFALPKDLGATVLGIGPQGLVALGGRTLFRLALPEVGSNGLRPLEAWPLDFAPTAMAVAPDGRIFLADGSRIRIISPEGLATGGWDLPDSSLPVPCLAATADRLFVASGQLKAVLAFDFQGRPEGRLEARPDQDFVVPGSHFAICAGPSGIIAVNPGKRGIMFFTLLGQQMGSWFRSGPEWDAFQGCCNPITVAALPSGAGGDWVVSAEKGVPRVKISDRQGKLRAVLETAAELGAGIQDIGLAVDASGRVYVLDSVKQEIRIHERQDS